MSAPLEIIKTALDIVKALLPRRKAKPVAPREDVKPLTDYPSARIEDGKGNVRHL